MNYRRGEKSAGRNRGEAILISALFALCASFFFFSSISAAADDNDEDEVKTLPPVEVKEKNDKDAGENAPTGTVKTLKPSSERGGASLSRELAAASGVLVRDSSDEFHLSTVSLRALDALNSAVFIDGVPINDPFSGVADLSLAPIEAVETINIYMSRAPLAYCEPTLGGAIEIILKKKKGASAGFKLGSYDSYNAHASYNGRGLRLFFSRSGSTGGYGFTNDAGTLQNKEDDYYDKRINNSSTRSFAFAAFSLPIPSIDSKLSFSAAYFSKNNGVPGLARMQSETAQYFSDRLIISAKGDFYRIAPDLALTLDIRIVRGGEVFTDEDADVSLYPGTSETAFLSSSMRAILTYRPADNCRFGLLAGWRGTEAKLSRRSPSGYGRDDGLNRNEFMAGLEAGLGVWGFDLAAGGDFSLVFDAGARDEAAAALGAYAGVRYYLFDKILALRGQFVRRVRVPTFGELYGSRAGIEGNPGLKNETSYTLEFGAELKFESERIVLGAAYGGYLTWAYDLAALYQNSQRTFKPINVGAAKIGGDEISLMVLAKGIAALKLSYARVTAVDSSDDFVAKGRSLPFRPKSVLSGDFSIDFIPLCELYALATYKSKSYADRANRMEIAGAVVFSAGLTFRPTKYIALNFEAIDLGDSAASYVVGYPMPGRRYFFAATLSTY